jgi:hypothetical protein
MSWSRDKAHRAVRVSLSVPAPPSCPWHIKPRRLAVPPHACCGAQVPLPPAFSISGPTFCIAFSSFPPLQISSLHLHQKLGRKGENGGDDLTGERTSDERICLQYWSTWAIVEFGPSKLPWKHTPSRSGTILPLISRVGRDFPWMQRAKDYRMSRWHVGDKMKGKRLKVLAGGVT